MSVGENELEATFAKQNKHAIVATIRYDERNYSVLYKGTVNMNYRDSQYPTLLVSKNGTPSLGEEAALKQKAMFDDRPESRYARADAKAVIHPYYERWVHELLDAVRLKLRRTQ